MGAGGLVGEKLFDGDDRPPHFIHRAHFEDESTGFYGQPYQAAPAPQIPPTRTKPEVTT